MKIVISTCLLGALLAPFSIAQQEPPVPVGSLTANQDTLREGAIPEVSWNIEYPSTVDEVVEIDEDDEITARTRLRVQVSVIGIGITNQFGTEFPSRSFIRFSKSGWHHIFTGTGSQVNPTINYVDQIIDQGETIRFAARVNVSGFNFFFNDSDNIKVLRNGDLPPSVAAGFDIQTSVADYLGPYVKDGRLSLGPMDIIYAAELTHTNPEDSGYDVQDTIVLVRFTEVED